MIKTAQLYKEEIKKKYIETWYNEEYMYYSGWSGVEELDIPNNNYDSHHFVSVDNNGNILGYISYSVSFVTMSADRFGAISFDKGNVLFAKDLYQIICDIFEKYHLNRLCWSCIADNPAIRGYRNFIKEHGGRECAYHKQICKLMDGKLHDDVEFEILAEEFKR